MGSGWVPRARAGVLGGEFAHAVPGRPGEPSDISDCPKDPGIRCRPLTGGCISRYAPVDLHRLGPNGSGLVGI